MGIILTTTGLPLLTSRGLLAAPAASTGAAPDTSPVPAPKPGVATVPLQGPTRTIAYRGVTFTFSTPVSWFASANGDPVVVSHADWLKDGNGNPVSSTSITSISPAGATNAGGYKINGAVKNPGHVSVGAWEQGYDGAPSVDRFGSSAYPYKDALNVDPGNTGSAIRINAGDSFTISKAVRAAGASDTGWKVIERYVNLTVMGTLPPSAGTWFRPGAAGATKQWLYRVEDINWNVFSSLPKPGSLGNAATHYAEIKTHDLHTIPLWMGYSQPGRRIQLTVEPSTYPIGYSNAGYSREAGRRRGMYLCSLHVAPVYQTEEDDRRALAVLMAQGGIDLDSAYQIGYHGGSGANQWYGYHIYQYLAAFMLGDAAMLGRAQRMESGLSQVYWTTPDIIGAREVNWDGGSAGSGVGYLGETPRMEELGKPGWAHTGPLWAGNTEETGWTGVTHRDKANAHEYAAYRDGFYIAHAWEVFGVGLLRNGPNGESGIEALNRRQAPQPGSNHITAALPAIDRFYRHTPAKLANPWGFPNEVRTLISAWRAHIPQPVWTGAPDVDANHADYPNFSTPGSGAGTIAWSLAGYDFATEPVTDRELQVSQDGIQFFGVAEIAGVGSPRTAGTHTIAGLRPGTAHWCRWRQRSASGWSPWSQSWEQTHKGGTTKAYHVYRGKVASSGTAPSGAGWSNLVLPRLHHKPYHPHVMPYYEPATSPAAGDVLYAGLGYWTGGSGAMSIDYDANHTAQTASAPAVAFQWQRNGTAIGGATAWKYTVQAADRGASIRCVVTVGGQPATSNAVGIR